MYEMKDEYLTGIKSIDDEHRHLFEIAEEAYQLQQDPFIADKYDALRDVMEQLRDYTKMHFSHEEEYMESINYKRLFTQKVEHNAFCEKLDALKLEDLDENTEGKIAEILEFLTDWLVHHILENDKLIGEK